MVLKQFHGYGALASDDEGIIEGVEEGERMLFAVRFSEQERIVKAVAMEYDRRSGGSGSFDFDGRCVARHNDDSRDAESVGVIRDRLSVIACGHGNDANSPLIRCQGQQLDESTALFEGTRKLEVFKFEDNIRARYGGQRFGVGAGRADDGSGD